MPWETEKEELAKEIVQLLYERRMIRTFFRDRPEGWTLISGLYSPVYIQLRPLASYPDVFEKVCLAMFRLLAEEAPAVSKVIGIAMAGVPVAAGLAVVGGIPAGFTRKIEGVKSVDALRKAISDYGEHALLEGELASGDRLALIDDLVTRFDSKLVALEQVRHEIDRLGLDDVQCDTVAVVLDREQGGQESARNHNLTLLSLVPFKRVGVPLLKDSMNEKEWDVVSRYLDDPDHFQSPEVQQELRDLAAAQ
jgi:orotate phosphoribosyltransferase